MAEIIQIRKVLSTVAPQGPGSISVVTVRPQPDATISIAQGARGPAGPAGPPGPQGAEGPSGGTGPAGSSDGSADPTKIPYTVPGDPTIATVADALARLLYVPITINSFTGGGTFEKGAMVTAANLAWSLSKAPTTQSISGIGPLAVDVRAQGLTGLSLTGNTSWTLTVSDGQTTRTAATAVQFLQKRHWGVTTQATLTDAEVRSLLSGEFASSRAQSRVFNCTGGKYFWIVYPAALGVAGFKVGGLAFSAMDLVTRSYTNASGFSETYHFYRVTDPQTGSAISVEVL